MNSVKSRLAAVVIGTALAFAGGVQFGHATAPAYHHAPVCVRTLPGGALAPASCGNPDSYRVYDGH